MLWRARTGSCTLVGYNKLWVGFGRCFLVSDGKALHALEAPVLKTVRRDLYKYLCAACADVTGRQVHDDVMMTSS